MKHDNLKFAYVLGMYLTDGYIHKDKGTWGLRLRNIDFDIQDYHASCLYELFGREPTITFYNDKTYYHSTTYESEFYNKDLCTFLENSTKSKSIIPEFVYDLDLDYQKEFLSGLLDGDGWCSVSIERMKTNQNPDKPNWHANIGLCGKRNTYIKYMPFLLDKMKIRYSHYDKDEPAREPMREYRLNILDFVDNNLYFHCIRKSRKLSIIKQNKVGQKYNLNDVQRLNAPNPETDYDIV